MVKMRNSVKGPVVNSTLIVDLGSIHRSFKSKYNKQIDYEKLINFVKSKYSIVNIYAYGTLHGESEAFRHMLEKLGMFVHLVPYNHNIQLTVGLMLAKTPQVILAADNPQYFPALDYMRRNGTLLIHLSANGIREPVCHQTIVLGQELSYEPVVVPAQGRILNVGGTDQLRTIDTGDGT